MKWLLNLIYITTNLLSVALVSYLYIVLYFTVPTTIFENKINICSCQSASKYSTLNAENVTPTKSRAKFSRTYTTFSLCDFLFFIFVRLLMCAKCFFFLWDFFQSEALRKKCPNTEFFLVCIFLYSDWIRRFTPLVLTCILFGSERYFI